MQQKQKSSSSISQIQVASQSQIRDLTIDFKKTLNAYGEPIYIARFKFPNGHVAEVSDVTPRPLPPMLSFMSGYSVNEIVPGQSEPIIYMLSDTKTIPQVKKLLLHIFKKP